MKALVVFSHLRWNFVYQRPQHILSRLAQQWPVVFIEEPIPGAEEDRIERIAAAPGVEVWRPHLRGPQHGFHPAHKHVLQHLLARCIAERGLDDYWLWFYTPMAVPMADTLAPEGIIYDCMDELSLFRGAPPELLAQERALFAAADVVFTGGRSLYNAKKDRHPNVHCFPSSVDAQHFRNGAADHPSQQSLARPRLGYCGVIDERIDLQLIAGIAQRRPDWQIVMVGPVVKIDPAACPRLPNIHWLGQQGYDDLPAFINGWDVCLLPFALNESTRFISPTKTLEYMACGKPSVSTAIRDVVEPYGHVVPIRADAEGFVQACDEILARSESERDEHRFALAAILAKTSWDATAAAMGELIAQAEAAREAQELPAVADIATELARATASLPASAAAH
ncbi:glycosyltransferase family 1 protein [Ramlibacter ginsenosidimutans]|uniref:Glycosyltransferase family 1 protein n=1 Tax=Ramlibacter ginsenosidimutans TaxID=502333 RepID=A0A934WKT5_9BURK|nr:glycosyltransferase family 1 protein [Ramlibacter ginsenosidimutans]MBK6004955.1 glycosyltransferase family 1 protein [Ramlibacter ginsenosidimutans]